MSIRVATISRRKPFVSPLKGALRDRSIQRLSRSGGVPPLRVILRSGLAPSHSLRTWRPLSSISLVRD